MEIGRVALNMLSKQSKKPEVGRELECSRATISVYKNDMIQNAV
jgi:hypothetical protein